MAARHALLIATETYTDPALGRLTAPGGDARALADVLSDPEIAGFEVTTLVDQPHHVVGEAIGEFYRGRRRDELTLLYFTGHGVKDDDGHLYLAMANTRRDSLMFTALAAEQVDRAMAGCASRQKVLVLDCCYSGAFPSGKLAKAGTDVHTLERFQGRGRAVLTASDATQYSFEGDEVVGSAARSVFTRHLVAGLRDGGADLDGDGDVTVDELYSYVHEHVVAEMPRQRPKHQSDVEGRIVLARNPHWALPEYLRHGLASPIAADRLTALEGLVRLNRVGNEVVRARTEAEIRRLVDDDSRMVSATARSWTRTPVVAVPGGKAPVAEVPAATREPVAEAPPVAVAAPPVAEISANDVPVAEMSVAEVSASGVVEVGDRPQVVEPPVEAAPAAEEASPIAPVAEVPTASAAEAVEAVEPLAAEPPTTVAKPDPVVRPARSEDVAAPAAARLRPAGPSVKRTAPPAPDVPGSSARDARFYLGTAALILALATGILLSVGVVNWTVLLLLLLFAVFLGLGLAGLRRQSK